MDTLDNPKLKKLLYKFLDPTFKVKNETYLNALLDHLKISEGMFQVTSTFYCYSEKIR